MLIINEQYKKVNNNVAVYITQKWSGHSTPDMLNRIYMHVNSDFEQSQIDKYNKEVNDTYNREKETIQK